MPRIPFISAEKKMVRLVRPATDNQNEHKHNKNNKHNKHTIKKSPERKRRKNAADYEDQAEPSCPTGKRVVPAPPFEPELTTSSACTGLSTFFPSFWNWSVRSREKPP